MFLRPLVGAGQGVFSRLSSFCPSAHPPLTRSASTAGCCTVLSVFGVITLCILGTSFDNNAEILLGTDPDPEAGRRGAKLCYSAAVVYAVFVAFCGCQLGVQRRYARGGQVGRTYPYQPLDETHQLHVIESPYERGRRRS